MLLSARILTDVANVNVYEASDVVEFTEGDAPTIYFQLVDASLDKGHRPPGRRYIPMAGATLQVVIQNIDDAKTVTRYAMQPFAQDLSIWSLVLQPTDNIRGVCSLTLKLTETSKVTRGFAENVIRALPQIRGR